MNDLLTAETVQNLRWLVLGLFMIAIIAGSLVGLRSLSNTLEKLPRARRRCTEYEDLDHDESAH